MHLGVYCEVHFLGHRRISIYKYYRLSPPTFLGPFPCQHSSTFCWVIDGYPCMPVLNIDSGCVSTRSHCQIPPTARSEFSRLPSFLQHCSRTLRYTQSQELLPADQHNDVKGGCSDKSAWNCDCLSHLKKRASARARILLQLNLPPSSL